MPNITHSVHVAAVAALAAGALAGGLHAQGATGAPGQQAAGPLSAAAAQAPGQTAPCARPAGAPPLVPVRLDRDGNFRIAPPYVRDPAFTEKPNVPKGRVIRFTMNSAESKIFPTAPVPAPRAGGPGGRAGQAPGAGVANAAGGGRAAGAPQPPPCPPAWTEPAATQAGGARAGAPGGRGGPAEPPTHQTFDRQIAVYVPAGYVPNTPAPFIVVQDERWYIPEDAPTGPDGTPRTDLAFMPVMLDNLIHEKRIPPVVAVLLSPGPGGQRTIEYDTISDRYLNFVETEVLPRITRDHQVAFTADPDGRATFGESSGSPVALNMAWFSPNLYRRVISYSGTFVALQRNAIAPNGAWDYHDKFIPNSEKKPIRIWLHVSGNDNGANTSAEGMRNWIIANDRMAAALKAKGYAYQYVFSEASGHVDRRVQLQTMPEAFEWVWKGYKPSGR
jgi:enterochelin esterase family protein